MVGTEWVLYVGERPDPLSENAEPEARVSLRESLGTVKARNLENESYSTHRARQSIDVESFRGSTDQLIREILDVHLE